MSTVSVANVGAVSVADVGAVSVADVGNASDAIDANLALATATYFDNLDATISASQKKTARRVTAARFVRLSARLSVYSLYCDLQNTRGYNQAYSNFVHANTQLATLTDAALGGSIASYNAFENARNEESLKFVQLEDPDQVCGQSHTQYEAYLNATPAKLTSDLSTAAFGTR